MKVRMWSLGVKVQCCLPFWPTIVCLSVCPSVCHTGGSVKNGAS